MKPIKANYYELVIKYLTIFRKNILLIVFGFILFISCKNNDNEQKYFFENNIWNSDSNLKFENKIDDITHVYKIIITLKVLATFNENNLPIYIKVLYPNNEERTELVNVLFLDSNGKRLGFLIDGLRTIEFEVNYKKTFNVAGVYKYELIQNSSQHNLKGIREVSLKFIKNKKSSLKDESE